jgi:hypothetical protein
MSATVRAGRFWKPFLAWVGLGVPGLVLVALGLDLDALKAAVALPDLPGPLLRLAIMGQPIVLLAVGTALGVALSDRAGLRAWLTDRLRGRAPAGLAPAGLAFAAGAGVVLGVAIAGADTLLAPLTGLAGATAGQQTGVLALATGLGYGGIVEELMMRYGLMTLLVWLGAVLLRRRPAALYWAALIIAAAAFAAGHLPAMAALVPLTPAIVARTLALNLVPGLLFGWLYWRRGLEYAMLAHMAAHIGMSAGALLL